MAAGLPAGLDLPSRIGRHSVVAYLASGGMAEIFLGKDAGGQIVVIKRILPQYARQQAFVSMFIDEGRIGSLIRHPNVVEIHELGQIGFELFMVMEYLAGENLAGLERRLVGSDQRLPFALAAHIVAEACAGLHAAHSLCDERGQSLRLVHRDISPQNIVVTYDGNVKVLDFGIATAAHRLTRTATGQVKGKFAYMSPEQILGEPLDLRTDIFALGVVLYELTTQRRLYSQPNELMLLKAITEDPIPPPSREVAHYPESLERICMKALSRDKNHRYGSALELRADLLQATSTLDPTTKDRRGALASWMTRLFAERIEDKREMLQKVRHGTQLDIIPPADVDENVEIPPVASSKQVNTVGGASTVAQVPETGAPRPVASPQQGDTMGRASTVNAVPETVVSSQPRRRGWAFGIAAIVLVGAGGGAWWFAYQDRGREEPATQPQTTPTVMPSPPIDARSRLTVRIESIPPAAVLSVDGQPRGPTPIELVFDEARRDLTLRLELDAHVTVEQRVSIDHDQRLVFTLPALPPPAPGSGSNAPAPEHKTKVRPPPPPADPFQRFD